MPAACSPKSSAIRCDHGRARHPPPLQPRIGGRSVAALHNGHHAVVGTYNDHRRIQGHADQEAAIEAVADAAFNRIIDGRDGLVVSTTNAIVDALNVTLTHRLVEDGWFDRAERIEIGACEFHPAQGETVDEADVHHR